RNATGYICARIDHRSSTYPGFVAYGGSEIHHRMGLEDHVDGQYYTRADLRAVLDPTSPAIHLGARVYEGRPPCGIKLQFERLGDVKPAGRSSDRNRQRVELVSIPIEPVMIA